MLFIGLMQIILGICGMGAGGMMYGDIGIACMVGGASALLSGIATLVIRKNIRNLTK